MNWLKNLWASLKAKFKKRATAPAIERPTTPAEPATPTKPSTLAKPSTPTEEDTPSPSSPPPPQQHQEHEHEHQHEWQMPTSPGRGGSSLRGGDGGRAGHQRSKSVHGIRAADMPPADVRRGRGGALTTIAEGEGEMKEEEEGEKEGEKEGAGERKEEEEGGDGNGKSRKPE